MCLSCCCWEAETCRKNCNYPWTTAGRKYVLFDCKSGSWRLWCLMIIISVYRFICALAVVAERQKLVERIVVTKDYCPEGAYVVRLCKSGSWKTLVVDDYFPVDQYQRLKYSKVL